MKSPCGGWGVQCAGTGDLSQIDLKTSAGCLLGSGLKHRCLALFSGGSATCGAVSRVIFT